MGGLIGTVLGGLAGARDDDRPPPAPLAREEADDTDDAEAEAERRRRMRAALRRGRAETIATSARGVLEPGRGTRSLLDR